MDELTLKCLISVHRHRSELNMRSSKEKGHFLQKTRQTDQNWGFTIINKWFRSPAESPLCYHSGCSLWLPREYDQGNHKPIFGLQLLAHLQSERDLSLWFSFVDDDFRLVIEFKGYCLSLVGRMMLSSREEMYSMISTNHWARIHGIGLLVRFLGHKRNMEQDNYTWNNFQAKWRWIEG